MITSGSLQALDLVNGILLTRGDTIITEAETYQGALNRWSRRGINAVGVALDRDGMRMDALAAALDDLQRRNIRPKYIYTVPTVQNPTGTIMPEERRMELLKLSEEHCVPIFEDDCYADLTWEGLRPPALHAMSKTGGVIHIGSFSKSVAQYCIRANPFDGAGKRLRTTAPGIGKRHQDSALVMHDERGRSIAGSRDNREPC